LREIANYIRASDISEGIKAEWLAALAAQEARPAPSRQQQIAAMEGLKTDPALLAKLAGNSKGK